MSEKKTSPPSPVSMEKATEHALFAVRNFWAHASRGLDGWDNVQLEKEPLVIHDLNGQMLFYEYCVMDAGTPLGLVKASASKLVGSAVPQIQVTPRSWDPALALKNSKEGTKSALPKAEIVDAQFVCYSYPKIGVCVKFNDPGVGEGTLIFDAASFNLVDRFGDFGRDGFASWSFYNDIALPQAESRENRWDCQDREVEALKDANARLMADISARVDRASIQKDLTRAHRDIIQREGGIAKPGLIFKSTTEKVIQFGPHCTTHDCYRLLPQQKDDYCAVATGQMILDFYRYYYTQDQIATAMGYVPGGCGQDGQIAGYETLSKKCLDASVDYSATWAKAAAEIDANRPLKSGIPGHARACFGYRAANIWIAGQPRPLWLFLLDPWPPTKLPKDPKYNPCEGGAITWEDWYAINHTNYIYVRHRTVPCA
jgi:hypothetical protein